MVSFRLQQSTGKIVELFNGRVVSHPSFKSQKVSIFPAYVVTRFLIGMSDPECVPASGSGVPR